MQKEVCKVELTERGGNSLDDCCHIAGLWHDKKFSLSTHVKQSAR